MFRDSIGESDFAVIPQSSFTNRVETSLSAPNDDITLEYADRVQLRFTPESPSLITTLEGLGEYVRDTVTVNITDDDREYLIIVIIHP